MCIRDRCLGYEALPFIPELLDALPEELAELFRSLEATLLDEICSRLKLTGELNEVTVQGIRTLRSHGIDLKEIEKAIQRTANISQRDLKKLLDDVVERNQRYYKEVIDLAGDVYKRQHRILVTGTLQTSSASPGRRWRGRRL